MSLFDFVDLARHFQKRTLEVLLRGSIASWRSAQYPSGNQTYSHPSRGGRGGSTPNLDDGKALESFSSEARIEGVLLFVKAPSGIAMPHGALGVGSTISVEGLEKVRKNNGGFAIDWKGMSK